MKIMKRDRQTLLHFLGMFIGASGMREKADDDVAWVAYTYMYSSHQERISLVVGTNAWYLCNSVGHKISGYN